MYLDIIVSLKINIQIPIQHALVWFMSSRSNAVFTPLLHRTCHMHGPMQYSLLCNTEHAICTVQCSLHSFATQNMLYARSNAVFTPLLHRESYSTVPCSIHCLGSMFKLSVHSPVQYILHASKKHYLSFNCHYNLHEASVVRLPSVFSHKNSRLSPGLVQVKMVILQDLIHTICAPNCRCQRHSKDCRSKKLGKNCLNIILKCCIF